MQIQSYQINLTPRVSLGSRADANGNRRMVAGTHAKRTPARRHRRERALPTGFALRRAPKVLPAGGTAHNCGALRGEEIMQRCAETHRHGRTASVRACVHSVDNKRIIFSDFSAALQRGRKVRK